MKRSINVSKNPPAKRQLLQNSTAKAPHGKKAKTTTTTTTTTATSGQSKTKRTTVRALSSKTKASRGR